MIKSLLNKIKLFYKKEEFNWEDIPTISKSELVTVVDNDILEINIKECSFKDFLVESQKIDKYNIDIKNFIYDGSFSKDSILKEQKIYILENKNKKYYITLGKSQLIISEYNKTDKNIHETNLGVDYSNNHFKISKFVHDLNYSTIEHQTYLSHYNVLKKYFWLEKNEALSLASNLLTDLEKMDGIDKIIDYYSIYEFLNLMPPKFYNPVIRDDKISLSWICSDNDNDINKQEFVLFDIVLNDTKEVVGHISFDYNNSGFSYYGNVSYEIKEEFKNNHYATRALSLLKKLLKSNEFKGNKDLYIATSLENIKSQKVIQNNNGHLIYEGLVPEDESNHYINGAKEVKVYHISLNNKKN